MGFEGRAAVEGVGVRLGMGLCPAVRLKGISRWAKPLEEIVARQQWAEGQAVTTLLSNPHKPQKN